MCLHDLGLERSTISGVALKFNEIVLSNSYSIYVSPDWVVDYTTDVPPDVAAVPLIERDFPCSSNCAISIQMTFMTCINGIIVNN